MYILQQMGLSEVAPVLNSVQSPINSWDLLVWKAGLGNMFSVFNIRENIYIWIVIQPRERSAWAP